MKPEEFRSQMTPEEFSALVKLYDKATTRKMFIFSMTCFVAMVTIVSLVVYQMSTNGLPDWMFFTGCGASVVVYGVVAVFAQLNDNVYDILTAIRPDLADS